MIRKKQGGRDEFNQKKTEIRSRLDEINGKINGLEEERTALLGKISEQQEQSRTKRNQVASLKKELKYETEEQIDEQLRELERFMITTSVTLQAEKDLVAKMQTLRKMKPLVRDYSALETDARSTDSTKLVPLKGRLDIIREELNKLRDRKREEASRNQILTEERTKSTAPVKDLFDQRTELHNQLTEHKKTLLEIRSEKNKTQQSYFAYLQQIRKARSDAEREERRKQDLIARKEKLERSLENLEMTEGDLPGMLLLRQTVAYTQRLVDEFNASDGKPIDKLEGDHEGGNSPTTASTPPMDAEFSKCVIPKNQRPDEDLGCGSKKKGRRDKKAAKAQHKKLGVVSHDLQIFADFEELGVTPPLVYDEAEECLAKLVAKLGELEGKRSEFEEKNRVRKEALQAEMAALEKQERDQLKAQVAGDEAAAATQQADDEAATAATAAAKKDKN